MEIRNSERDQEIACLKDGRAVVVSKQQFDELNEELDRLRGEVASLTHRVEVTDSMAMRAYCEEIAMYQRLIAEKDLFGLRSAK